MLKLTWVSDSLSHSSWLFVTRVKLLPLGFLSCEKLGKQRATCVTRVGYLSLEWYHSNIHTSSGLYITWVILLLSLIFWNSSLASNLQVMHLLHSSVCLSLELFQKTLFPEILFHETFFQQHLSLELDYLTRVRIRRVHFPGYFQILSLEL